MSFSPLSDKILLNQTEVLRPVTALYSVILFLHVKQCALQCIFDVVLLSYSTLTCMQHLLLDKHCVTLSRYAAVLSMFHVKNGVSLMMWFASTYFGREKEISGHTWFDGQGVEFDQNHWMLVLHTPSSEILDVPPPAEAMTECPQICHNPCVNAESEEVVKVPTTCDQASGCN